MNTLVCNDIFVPFCMFVNSLLNIIDLVQNLGTRNFKLFINYQKLSYLIYISRIDLMKV